MSGERLNVGRCHISNTPRSRDGTWRENLLLWVCVTFSSTVKPQLLWVLRRKSTELSKITKRLALKVKQQSLIIDPVSQAYLQHLRVSESLSEKLWWSDFKLLTVVFCTLSNSFIRWGWNSLKLIKRLRAPLPRLSAAVLPSFFSSSEFPSFLGHYLTLINAVPQISLKRLHSCTQGSRGSLSAVPDKWHIHMQSFYSSLI